MCGKIYPEELNGNVSFIDWNVTDKGISYLFSAHTHMNNLQKIQNLNYKTINLN